MNDQELVAPRGVDNVRELVDLVDLSKIVTYSLSASRVANNMAADDMPQQSIEALSRHHDTGIEARFVLDVEVPGAKFMADISAQFAYCEPLTLSPTVAEDFLSEVALMVVFPYLRESVMSLASRLGMDGLVVGLVKRGDFKFGRKPAP